MLWIKWTDVRNAVSSVIRHNLICITNLKSFGVAFHRNHSCEYKLLISPDSKVHGADMGPIWGRQDPGGPHVGSMNFAIWVTTKTTNTNTSTITLPSALSYPLSLSILPSFLSLSLLWTSSLSLSSFLSLSQAILLPSSSS